MMKQYDAHDFTHIVIITTRLSSYVASRGGHKAEKITIETNCKVMIYDAQLTQSFSCKTQALRKLP